MTASLVRNKMAPRLTCGPRKTPGPDQPLMEKGWRCAGDFSVRAALPTGLWRHTVLLILGSHSFGESLRSYGGPEHWPGHPGGSWTEVQKPRAGATAHLTQRAPSLEVLCLPVSSTHRRTRRWLHLPFYCTGLLGPRARLCSQNHTLITLIRTVSSTAWHFQICWLLWIF